jgi:putative peptide zinc metalloprotease protein
VNQPAAIRLLPDLKFTPHVQRDKSWYAVEDPQTGRFIKLGFTEYLVVSGLQRGLGPLEIAQVLQQHDYAPDAAQQHVAATVSWLMRQGLVVPVGGAAQPAGQAVQASAQAPGMAGAAQPAPGSGVAGTPEAGAPTAPRLTKGIWAFDPFFIRVPLLSGNLTEALAAPFRKLISPWALVVWAGVWLVALGCLLHNSERFLSAGRTLFVQDGRMWWLVAWLVLKAVHELGHAVAAMRVGSRIRSAGIQLIYLAPVPFIDVTDLWEISTRRHRVLVSAAGMLFELAVAALAVIVASCVNSPSLQYFCVAVATLGTVTTIGFNANPLMRFDGYYIISDLFSRPNLWTEAQQACQRVFARLLDPFGQAGEPLNWPLAIYGGACWCYRMLVIVTLVWWLVGVWDGIGILVSLWAGYCWFFRPWYLRRQATRMAQAAAAKQAAAQRGLAAALAAVQPASAGVANAATGVATGAATGDRAASVGGAHFAGRAWLATLKQVSTWGLRTVYLGVLAGILAAVAMLPSPWSLQAPGVIGFANPTAIRAVAEGFLSELPVSYGQLVAEGQLLAKLENPELQAELATARLKLESSQEQSRSLRARGELALAQAEEAKAESLKEHVAQLAARARTLEIRAPHAGMVILSNSERPLGRFVSIGQQIAMVVEPGALEIRALASQRDATAFLVSQDKQLKIRGTTGRTARAQLISVDCRGSDVCPEPALAARYGGPLAVELGPAEQGSPQLKLGEARFELIAAVTAPSGQEWVPGQLVSVTLLGSPQRLGSALWDAAYRKLRNRADSW